ncbi:MAG: hypothetical protein ABDK94_08200 [Atribacterota bacterium]
MQGWYPGKGKPLILEVLLLPKSGVFSLEGGEKKIGIHDVVFMLEKIERKE